MNDKISTFEEYTMNDDFSSKHRIDEMATISRPTDNIPRNSKVIVYGENDEQATKTPHFHVQIDNGDIEVEIKFEHIKNMDIWRTNNYPKSWNGITDVRDRIVEWFDEVTKNNFGLSNLKRMIMAWNDANPTNEIDEQFTESFTISKLEIHYWTEVSGIIEHYYFKKHNGFPIPNNMASKILGVPDSQITPSKKDMIHYNRVIGAVRVIGVVRTAGNVILDSLESSVGTIEIETTSGETKDNNGGHDDFERTSVRKCVATLHFGVGFTVLFLTFGESRVGLTGV